MILLSLEAWHASGDVWNRQQGQLVSIEEGHAKSQKLFNPHCIGNNKNVTW